VRRKRTPAISEFQGSNNEKELYDIGERLEDLSLVCDYFHEEDAKFLEELALRNLEAYIYSGVPGSILQSCPLTRGVRGDPQDGTYTGTLAEGTTVYWPSGDTSSETFLEETDFETYPILANGLQYHSGLHSTLSHELPLGRGVAILSKAKNQIKNSGFADDGTDVYNWTLTGAGGIGGINRLNVNGWMGVRELQIWGTNVWQATAFDGSVVQGKNVAISFGWRTDGELEVEFDSNDGGGWGTHIVLDKGMGYYHGIIAVPALAGNIDIRFSVKSGTLSGICAPQINLNASVDTDFYYAYLEGLAALHRLISMLA
jgi:hypothetical protein